MGTVYAIANQKGGVGKTTTAVNLAACVAEAGYEALLIDIDPQCNATLGLGLAKDAPRTVYDVLMGDASLDEVIQPTSIEHLSVAPAGPGPRRCHGGTPARRRLGEQSPDCTRTGARAV